MDKYTAAVKTAALSKEASSLLTSARYLAEDWRAGNLRFLRVAALGFRCQVVAAAAESVAAELKLWDGYSRLWHGAAADNAAGARHCALAIENLCRTRGA